MARILAIAALAAAIALARPLAAEPTQRVFADAATLRTWCLGRGAVRATCLGYLSGAVDALREPSLHALLASGGMALCLPAKLASEQVRLMFLNHVHEHPDRQRHGAVSQIHAALHGAFACSPRPAPGRDSVPGPGERVSSLHGPGDGAARGAAGGAAPV